MIALVTCQQQPELSADDALLGAALTEHGVEWRAVPWNGVDTDWAQFDAIILRSTWDYHVQLDAFFAWIARVEQLGIALWNTPATLRWNAHKHYLRELQSAGIEIVPTHWIRQGDTVDLGRVLADRGWDEVVVKPAVSATAHGLVRACVADAERQDAALTRAAANVDLLVQPFMPEIEKGELSLIFFDGEFSHAVRKRPKAGDFRVQSKFGGSVDLVQPSAAFIDQARAATSFASDLLYARVDGLEVQDRFVIMELELIEPELFFHTASHGAQTLAKAIVRRIAG